MWSDAEARDETIVVSLIGLAWSPKIPPDSTAAMKGVTGRPSVIATGTAIGSMMPNVPQLLPVAKAMPPATRNRSVASRRASTTP